MPGLTFSNELISRDEVRNTFQCCVDVFLSNSLVHLAWHQLNITARNSSCFSCEMLQFFWVGIYWILWSSVLVVILDSWDQGSLEWVKKGCKLQFIWYASHFFVSGSALWLCLLDVLISGQQAIGRSDQRNNQGCCCYRTRISHKSPPSEADWHEWQTDETIHWICRWQAIGGSQLLQGNKWQNLVAHVES